MAKKSEARFVLCRKRTVEVLEPCLQVEFFLSAILKPSPQLSLILHLQNLTSKSESTNSSSDEASFLLPQQPRIRPLAKAAFELSVMAFSGLAGDLLPRNDTLAFKLLNDSAEGGDLQANLALAYRYHQGNGILQDCDRAFRLVRCLRQTADGLTSDMKSACIDFKRFIPSFL